MDKTPILFWTVFGLLMGLFVVILIGYATEEVVTTSQYCSSQSGVVFEHTRAAWGIFEEDDFRFMTPTEFDNYCIRKVEGTK